MDAPSSSELPQSHTVSDPASSPAGTTLSAPNPTAANISQSNPIETTEPNAILAPDDASKPTSTGDNIETTPTSPTTSTQSIVRISLLLTTGSRHPMTITRNYLKKRSMVPEDGDPYNITVYQLKQLIWNDWRSDWQERPSSPTYIRLIFFGSLLVDAMPLKDCRFSRAESNVVHMTIKPQELIEEEEKITKDTKNRDGTARSGGLNCCVIL